MSLFSVKIKDEIFHIMHILPTKEFLMMDSTGHLRWHKGCKDMQVLNGHVSSPDEDADQESYNAAMENLVG